MNIDRMIELYYKTENANYQLLCLIYWHGKECIGKKGEKYYGFNRDLNDLKNAYRLDCEIKEIYKIVNKYCSAYLKIKGVPVKLENRTHVHQLYDLLYGKGMNEMEEATPKTIKSLLIKLGTDMKEMEDGFKKTDKYIQKRIALLRPKVVKEKK